MHEQIHFYKTGRTYGECFRSDFLSAQKDYRERWRPGKRDFERNSHCSKQTIFCGFTGRLLEEHYKFQIQNGRTTKTHDQVETPEDFYQSAVSFGNFQRLLADYPAETLHETIVGFHDTKARFATFKKAVEEDVCGRAASVQKEIDFVLAHEDVANVFGDMLANGELPLRVTHNDTKLNNIMIDDKTGKGICVIDLDTVMPGLAMNDFGDSIRFGASTAAEDEQDLSKVSCDMELFDVYAKGFIEGCGGKLTQKEIEMMPMGAKVMTFECGMRFLTDHLQGDTYFKIHRENHNLDRCRTQFKLVEDMEAKWDTMQEIIKKYNS